MRSTEQYGFVPTTTGYAHASSVRTCFCLPVRLAALLHRSPSVPAMDVLVRLSLASGPRGWPVAIFCCKADGRPQGQSFSLELLFYWGHAYMGNTEADTPTCPPLTNPASITPPTLERGKSTPARTCTFAFPMAVVAISSHQLAPWHHPRRAVTGTTESRGSQQSCENHHTEPWQSTEL